MLKSSFTEWELHDVLGRRQLAALVPQASREWLMALLAAAELVAITETIAACRDRDDDKFLELAVSGRADFIVSGDADLLASIRSVRSRSSRRLPSSSAPLPDR